MNHTYSITYLTCQSCTAKIHCEKCASELQERLMQERGVGDVQIDIPNRSLKISAEGMDEMDLLDLLEEAGIFAD